ncbi:MAG TPA: hypothetical protein PLX85_00515 [Dehalococcoidia bacterium]|nr:hypothetical protein [Dehalococcoidia bacterium]
MYVITKWESIGQVYLRRIGDRGQVYTSEHWHESVRFREPRDAEVVLTMLDSLKGEGFTVERLTARCERTA